MDKLEKVTLTKEQKKALRSRNYAVLFILVGFVAIFYVATLFKFDPSVLLNRPQ